MIFLRSSGITGIVLRKLVISVYTISVDRPDLNKKTKHNGKIRFLPCVERCYRSSVSRSPLLPPPPPYLSLSIRISSHARVESPSPLLSRPCCGLFVWPLPRGRRWKYTLSTMITVANFWSNHTSFVLLWSVASLMVPCHGFSLGLVSRPGREEAITL